MEGRPCWSIIWLWVLSIAQYSYRYILQVNDPNSSLQYHTTPAPLSAIKYALFCLFAAYATIALLRRPTSISAGYRRLLSGAAGGIAVLIAVLLVRLAVLPGALDETGKCAVELIPWIAIILFIPFVFHGEHSVTKTLLVFERVSFWILFPFWLVTVALAVLDIRYPALSYPGLLVRFGGILDDPNGYACLCLLLMVLAGTSQAKRWKLRLAIYLVMLIATISLTGYLTGIVICLGFLCTRMLRRRASRPLSLVAKLSVVTVLVVVTFGLMAMYQTTTVLDTIASLYAAKSNSTTIHLSNILPDETAWDTSSPVSLVLGSGGFSENFYWRIRANFGWMGLLTVIAMVAYASYLAFRRSIVWRYPLGIWTGAVLIGCNGIAYLLTFPMNLIFWSVLALLVCQKSKRILRTSDFPEVRSEYMRTAPL